MITLSDISILIVSAVKDLNRLNEVYVHIRAMYPENEIVVVYDNINQSLITADDVNLIQVPTTERVYVSRGYNLAMQQSTKPAFVFLHDDTYPAPGFLENLLPHITETQFCNFCQVEPPVFNEKDSIYKPIRNFGLKDTAFQKNAFFEFCRERELNLETTSQPSPYGGFFMSGMKSSFIKVGGFDETFNPYFHEDADLMIRMHMAGYRFILALDSIVYHVGSLTSRHSEDSALAHRTTFDIFLNKWKTTFKHYSEFSIDNDIEYVKPKMKIDCINCDDSLNRFAQLLSASEYNTEVVIDGATITKTDIDYLYMMPYILNSHNESGVFYLGNLKIRILT